MDASILRWTKQAALATWLIAAGAYGGQEAHSATVPSMSLQEIIRTGGWPMFVLGAMSVAGLAFVVYFCVVLRNSQITPMDFVHDLREMLEAGREDEALRAARKNNTPIATIVLAALEHMKHAGAEDSSQLREVMESEGSRQATLLQNQTQYLLDIAVVAPMVGLLGTVMGMMRAFNAVALDIAKARPIVLAGGVSQALITTATGLIVGIPAMICYAYFRGRTGKLIARLEVVASGLTPLLSAKRKAN